MVGLRYVIALNALHKACLWPYSSDLFKWKLNQFGTKIMLTLKTIFISNKFLTHQYILIQVRTAF